MDTVGLTDHPYAAVQRRGETVEYWAASSGRVVRRHLVPDRPPRLGGWNALSEQSARREIDAVVRVKLSTGWSLR